MIDSILTFCDEVLSNPVWFYIITLLIKIVICFAITILFIPVCVYICLLYTSDAADDLL